MPYKVAFEDESSDAAFIFDLCVDASFLTDIVLTFMSVYDDGTGKYVTNRRMIAKNYLKGWFTIDLLTSLPFQILEKMGTAGEDSGLEN